MYISLTLQKRTIYKHAQTWLIAIKITVLHKQKFFVTDDVMRKQLCIQ